MTAQEGTTAPEPVCDWDGLPGPLAKAPASTEMLCTGCRATIALYAIESAV